MVIKKTETANENYLAKIIRLKGLRKHENADRLQCVTIDFQNVITGLDAKEGDIYVYFPIECAINHEFLSFTNSFRDSELNQDKDKTGFFENNCRVRAMRLREEKSCGYIVPVQQLVDFVYKSEGITFNPEDNLDTYFDQICSILICKKYIPKNLQQQGNGKKAKQGQEPKISRLLEGQVRLHVNTANFRQNSHRIHPSDLISVTYKTHGTSWWTGNLLVKKNLKWYERILKSLGVNIVEVEYDIIYGSRKVVKNQYLEHDKNKDHFYGYDLWNDIKNEVQHALPKGITLYGECIGYTKDGAYIQKGYDYGCEPHFRKLEVYRITQTNLDGTVIEFSYPQIVDFCNLHDLTPSFLFYYGKAQDMYPDIEVNQHWNENFLKRLENDYNEKNCFMCTNIVPEEGIVIRKESLYDCESYKLKSFRFLEYESKQLDSGEVDIETEN